MSENVTIHDVAAEAKVSIATVSRVLNNLDSVKDSTKERVYAAMRTVGYPIPEAVTAVPAEKSKIILIMVTNIGNMFTGKEVDGIFSTAYDAGYDCVIYRHRGGPYSFEEMRSIADSANACGIIMSLPNVPAEVMNKLSEAYPVVQFSEFAEGCDVPFVSVDDYTAGKMATSLLLKLGRRRIAIINGPTRFKYARERLRGYADALREYGLEPDPGLNVNLYTDRYDTIYYAVNQIVNAPNPPDGIFTIGDGFGVVAVNAALASGKRIPRDLAIVSCEDTEMARYSAISLTTVSQPIFHIGEQACKMLIDLIEGHTLSPSQVFLNVELVVRDSA